MEIHDGSVDSRNYESYAWVQEESHGGVKVQIGLAFRNLSVHAFIPSSQYQRTVASYLFIIPQFFASALSHRSPTRVQILQGFSGLINPGEMLLVLGRPGSGCSTLLKTLAGDTHGIHLQDNQTINYQGISYHRMHNEFQGQSLYLAEHDVHFPELSLSETLCFAATTQERGPHRNVISRGVGQKVGSLFNLDAVMQSKIGNAMIRGVSGGEKKRVSLAEAFMSNGQIQCWDNSTRGLDSSTALGFIRLLRSATTASGSTVLMSLYQASEAMYDNFDKVILLYEGRQIYFGTTSYAVEYFTSLGFVRPSRTTTADFLTSLTHPEERIIRPGCEESVPRTPDEFASAWRCTPQAKTLIAEIDEFTANHPCKLLTPNANASSNASTEEEARLKSSTYPTAIRMQVASCARRGVWRLRNNYSPVIAGIVGNTIIAIIIGSVFYKLDASTKSLEKRAVLIFFATMVNALTPAFEVLTIWAQRPIVEKHSRYAWYHPFVESCAAIICDLPNKVATSVAFNITLYFMTNLRRTPSAFFVYYLFTFVTIMAMSMFFRMVGSLSRTNAQTMAPVSIMVLIFVSYAGFVIPPDHMAGWLRWLRWLNPIAYAYESLMINEFHGRNFFCSNMIPFGRGYDSLGLAGKICPTVGASPGEYFVQGSAYIALKYGYKSGHLWRNLPILFSMMVLFGVIQLLAAEYIPAQRSRGEILLFRGRDSRESRKASDSEQIEQCLFAQDLPSNYQKKAKEIQSEVKCTDSHEESRIRSAVFHWEHVNYCIKLPDGNRNILSDVEGWVKPGTLTALMGATGAGKTSLLDVLAARTSVGTITGEIRIDGRLRDKSFQRRISYVQQEDIHLPAMTVREALEFSALLRQPKELTRAEKLDYVETILKMLNMESYANAVIGIPGEGLNVEQRKRLTIAVEMVAKPELLLFLDEPTSGLDSQTAWSICMLLRILANNGQAILCTIHQPSSQLFQIFDRLLLLEKGGKTLYFGEIGQDASTLVHYFTKNGAEQCGPDQNPAEWIMKLTSNMKSDNIPQHESPPQEWSEIWQKSNERCEVQRHLETLKSSSSSRLETDCIQPRELKGEYATTYREQFASVFKRVCQEYWRDPVYLYSKVALSAGVALCTGISFYNTRLDMQGVQNVFFSGFVLTQLFSTVDQQIIPRFIDGRTLFEGRERRSKSYSWLIFVAANVLIEMFWQTVTSVLVFVAWYYPTGLWRNGDENFTTTARGGLTFTILWVFCLFISTFSQAVAVGMELAETAVQIATLFFYLCLIFCGVIVPPAGLPGFWTFMHRVSPLTYFIGGIVTAGLADTAVTCSPTELLHIIPPLGQTCQEYLAEFVHIAGGYIEAVEESSECVYCPVSQANTILASYGIDAVSRWQNAGYLVAYVIANTVAIFGIYWAARLPK